MSQGVMLAEPGAGARTRTRREWVIVERRGPILRPSPQGGGVFGLDLTAGCVHGCAFCHIRGASRFPGEGRILFDPRVPARLPAALDSLAEPPRLVVLSPASDPLPPVRAVREATLM